ncbi:MAG: thymidylate synthase [Desulfosoma sp.]
MKPVFLPIHCQEHILRLNPTGTVGLLTLWSRPDVILERLRRRGADLDPETSPVAAVGTLYGNGLRELLRNLLYNPQIDTLVVYGRDRSGSLSELQAFFELGLEPYEGSSVAYEPNELETPKPVRIRGTGRVIDNLVRPEHFQRPPVIRYFGSPQDNPDAADLIRFLQDYRPDPNTPTQRLRIPLPRVRVIGYPSNPRAHTIVAEDPLSAWKDLIATLYRFGTPVTLAKGERRELQNVKVVVENPRPIPDTQLQRYGFDPERLCRYQQDILSGAIEPDETYNYGNRLRAYFGLDSLQAVIERLRRDLQDRKAYAVLWDPRRDLTAETGHPCLVSIFFRIFQGTLTLTAVFRTHNALDAWLVNFYGLMAVQHYVAHRLSTTPGPITVFSHSITIDTAQEDRASIIAAEKSFQYREDPMGYFRIRLDKDAIVVEHRHGDVTLKTYRHTKASRIQHELARDGALSDINHALYVGRQLERAERCLRDGSVFRQE